MNVHSRKGNALLGFLKDAATLRRKRVPSYGPSDKVLWFADAPKARRLLPENSVFAAIILRDARGDEFHVIAEVVEVLR